MVGFSIEISTFWADGVGKPYLVERSELEWNGQTRDECEWGIMEEAHLEENM